MGRDSHLLDTYEKPYIHWVPNKQLWDFYLKLFNSDYLAM